MYRKYYSYNDMPRPIQCNNEPIKKPQEDVCHQNNNSNKLFGKFETDDIILAIVIVMLLANDCDDKLLLLALAFVFFTGFDGF